jgi:Ni/Co efflux regulator RcnB
MKTRSAKFSTTLSTIGLALALAVGTSSVMAAGNHGDRHNRGWNSSHEQSRHGAHQRRDNYNRHARVQHRSSHYNRWSYNSYRYRGYSPSHWRHRSRGGYYPSYIGVRLAGSLIGHSAYHLHSGAVCYDAHQRDGRPGNYNEVVGCHRIERMPDGNQRRVEVPLSQCK